MKHIITKVVSLVFLFSLITLISCDDDETKPVFGVAFETTAAGVEDKDETIDIKLTFSVPARVASEITIDVLETGVSHGSEYQTTPAPVANKITVSVPVGAESASFAFKRLAEFIDSGKKVKFTASVVTGESNAVISGNTSIEVSFEAVASPGSSLVAEAGGPTEPNQVFVDFSQNKQTTVARTSWDLGFYAGDKNRVILNYSTYTLAKALDKTDMNAVTSADTVGMKNTIRLTIDNSNVFIDNPNGDLTATVIAEVSATDSQNKVYIINRGGGPGLTSEGQPSVSVVPRGWKKVRILKNGDGYKLQYADINATTFQEATINKNSLYNFNFFSFENGVASVEPKKNEWEICFTVSSNVIPGTTTAYGYSDFVRTNGTGGVTAVEIATKANGVDTGAKSYEAFTLADVTGLTFSNTNNSIGSRWRSTPPPTIIDYRYFIVKDSEGNYYKVKFLSFMNDAGERGHTTFKYELLK